MKALVIGSALLAAVASVSSAARAETVGHPSDSYAQMPHQARVQKHASMPKQDAASRETSESVRAWQAAEKYMQNGAGAEVGGDAGGGGGGDAAQ